MENEILDHGFILILFHKLPLVKGAQKLLMSVRYILIIRINGIHYLKREMNIAVSCK